MKIRLGAYELLKIDEPVAPHICAGTVGPKTVNPKPLNPKPLNPKPLNP